MIGAPLLAALATLRVGAGLTTIASTASVIDKLEKRVLEVMTLTLPNKRAIDTLEEFITSRKVATCVIGPGLRPDFAQPVIKFLCSINMPTIVDGGGLTALQHQPKLLAKQLPKNLILTPHLGEFQRFFSKPLPKTARSLWKLASNFASEHSIILVLKGHPTLVFSPKGEIYENPTGGPALATAGSGDVLAGMIAGLISQGIEPLAASQAAVYLHGLAGDIAAKAKTEPGVIASDIIEAIPDALKTLT